MLLSYIYDLFLLVTFIVSVFMYSKYKTETLRYLPFFLAYVLLTEIVAYALAVHFATYNLWWYNIFTNFEILFYLFIFYSYFKNKKIKRGILIMGSIYEINFLANFFILSSDYNIYQGIPFTIGRLILILAIFLFLIEMFQSDKILYVKEYLIFWVSIGLLSYNITLVPISIFYYFDWRIENLDSILSLSSIQMFINYILYTAILYGLLWSKKPYK